MDVLYVALMLLLGLMLAGMALGCARLEGPGR